MGRGAPAARRDDVDQRQSQDVAVEMHGLAQLPGGAGGVVHAMQARRGEVVAVMIGSMDVGLQKARTQPRRQVASRRVAAGSSPSASARPWWSPRMRRWVLSAAGIASWMARTSEGKQAWSPVYSMISVGWTMPWAVRARLALDDRPDQVDSQLSGVQKRAKPTAP